MKTKKTLTVLLLLGFALSLAAAALSLTGCDDKGDDPPPDDPKTQTATITGLFDNNSSATVTGTFTNAEWEGVPATIKTALNARFAKWGEGAKGIVKDAFSTRDITIIVEKNPTYANYSTTSNGNEIRINFAILNDEEALDIALAYSCVALAGADVPIEG